MLIAHLRYSLAPLFPGLCIGWELRMIQNYKVTSRLIQLNSPGHVFNPYLGCLCQGVEVLQVVQAKSLPEVSKDKWTVLLDLEVAGKVLLVEGVVVDLHLGEGSEVIRHEHHRDADMLQLLKKDCWSSLKLDSFYLDSVVYSPHENREYRVIGSEKFSFWVFHLGTQEKLKNVPDSDLLDITLNFLVFILAMELSIFVVFLRFSFVYSSPSSSPLFLTSLVLVCKCF